MRTATWACLALSLAAPSYGLERTHPRPGLRHRFFISPDEIRSLDTRTLAESLVQRLHDGCDLAGAPGPGEEPVGDASELIMMIPARAVGPIAEHGFLNQHATLTSQGVYRASIRFEAEQELAMARLPYSRKGRELLPKYALLVVDRPDFGTFPLPTRYGPVAVVFKREVLRRATWTYADSADLHFQAGRFSRGGAANPVLTHTARYRRKPEDKNRCGNYCEAQIWGALSFADVDYAMVRDSEPVPSSLMDSGLRVYRFSPAAGAPARFVRGELLSPGRPGARRPPVALGPAELAKATATASDPAVLNHLKDVERASKSDAELAGRIGASALDIGELSARPKSAVVVRALKEALRSSDPEIRALALYGLSELPWAEARPYLLDGLRDASPLVDIGAIALASEHLDDPEVDRLLGDLRKRPERELLETVDWLDRLRKPRLCE